MFHTQDRRRAAYKLADDLEKHVVGTLVLAYRLPKVATLILVGGAVGALGNAGLAELGWIGGPLSDAADAEVWRIAGRELLIRAGRDVASDPQVRRVASAAAGHTAKTAKQAYLWVSKKVRR